MQHNTITTNKTVSPTESLSKADLLNSLTPFILGFLFLGSLGLAISYVMSPWEWSFQDIFRVNGFTILIWMTVTFFSALINVYSNTYLKGSDYHTKFTALSLGFTISIVGFVMSNHIIAFLLFWLLMGFFMARLIGVNSKWGEAQEASKFAQRFFLLGSVSLALGVGLLSYERGSLTVDSMVDNIDQAPIWVLSISALLMTIAAMVQSAIYPFHRWLLSAMTSPTPASALMHAGFVNGSGILLAIFASLMISSNFLTVLFIIGGLTAVIAQFTKLLQVNVKQKLACSTIAQMGFMLMQCGLGFFNAAVAHLILHGFYKAYLFLSSGEEVERGAPVDLYNIRITSLQSIAVLIMSGIGAALFMFLTGKTSFTDSSIFLTLIVAIAVGQVTYNIVKQESLSFLQKLLVPPALFTAGIVLYALIYNGVTFMMGDMPFANAPQSISAIEIIFGVLFLLGFFVMKLGIYRKTPWLYVKLLNLSQPNSNTILKFKTIGK